VIASGSDSEREWTAMNASGGEHDDDESKWWWAIWVRGSWKSNPIHLATHLLASYKFVSILAILTTLVTRQTLRQSIVPWRPTLMAKFLLQPTTNFPYGNKMSSQVPLYWKALILLSMVCCQPRWTKASPTYFGIDTKEIDEKHV